jgi:hypothetical protein
VLPCPVCKAENAQGPACRRCKADLSLLFRLEAHRASLVAAAAESLRTGRLAEALVSARHAHELRHGEDSGRLLALTGWLRRDYAAAWRAFERLTAR